MINPQNEEELTIALVKHFYFCVEYSADRVAKLLNIPIEKVNEIVEQALQK